MAIKTWSGAAGDGNFGTAGNYVGGVAPVNSDTVVFDRSDKDVTAGLTSGLTGLVLVGTDGYKGTIAPGSTPLNAAWASVRWAAGSLNISGNITTGRFELRRGSLFTYPSGTLATAFFMRSQVSIEAAAVVTRFRSWASVIDDLYNATGYTRAELAGGSVLKSYRGGLIISKSASTAEILGSGVLSDGSEARTLGTIKYLSDAAIAGEVIVEPDGRFTARENATAFTYSSGTLSIWPGAKYNLNTRAGLVEPGTLNAYAMSGEADVGGPTLI